MYSPSIMQVLGIKLKGCQFFQLVSLPTEPPHRSLHSFGLFVCLFITFTIFFPLRHERLHRIWFKEKLSPSSTSLNVDTPRSLFLLCGAGWVLIWDLFHGGQVPSGTDLHLRPLFSEYSAWFPFHSMFPWVRLLIFTINNGKQVSLVHLSCLKLQTIYDIQIAWISRSTNNSNLTQMSVLKKVSHILVNDPNIHPLAQVPKLRTLSSLSPTCFGAVISSIQ